MGMKITYADAGNVGLALSASALAYSAATNDVKVSAILTPLGLALKAFGSYMNDRALTKEKAAEVVVAPAQAPSSS